MNRYFRNGDRIFELSQENGKVYLTEIYPNFKDLVSFPGKVSEVRVEKYFGKEVSCIDIQREFFYMFGGNGKIDKKRVRELSREFYSNLAQIDNPCFIEKIAEAERLTKKHCKSIEEEHFLRKLAERFLCSIETEMNEGRGNLIREAAEP
jgi:hypothetical protein